MIRDEDESIILQVGEEIGWATNNEAEYGALIAGLHHCHLLGAREVVVRADSQLVVRQMSGHWQVKHPKIKLYHEEASKDVKRFKRVDFEWIPRAKNSLADHMANIALGKEKALKKAKDQ